MLGLHVHKELDAVFHEDGVRFLPALNLGDSVGSGRRKG